MTADPAALNIIARKADGAMRDALSIFDQVAASSEATSPIRVPSTISTCLIIIIITAFSTVSSKEKCWRHG